jgi:hypothetical protein
MDLSWCIICDRHCIEENVCWLNHLFLLYYTHSWFFIIVILLWIMSLKGFWLERTNYDNDPSFITVIGTLLLLVWTSSLYDLESITSFTSSYSLVWLKSFKWLQPIRKSSLIIWSPGLFFHYIPFSFSLFFFIKKKKTPKVTINGSHVDRKKDNHKKESKKR